MFQYSSAERTVPVSVPGKRFRRFRFRVRFLGKRFRRFRFPVLVRFLDHPVFLLTARSFLLTVEVFVGYGNLVWSFLLTVENQFGLFCLRFPLSGNWVWSFLLTVPPPLWKLVLVFFYLRFPHHK